MTILTMYYKSKGGGFFTRLCRLISACAQHGITVHYLAPAPFPNLENSPSVIWHKAWIFGPEMLQKIICLLFLPFQVLAITLKHKIDRIVPFGSAYAAVSFPAHLLLKIPVITFLRGCWIRELKYKKADPLTILVAYVMNKTGLASSDLLVPNSENLASDLRSQGIDTAKVVVLPNDVKQVNTVDKAKAKREVCETYNLPFDTFLIAYIGTFKTLKRAWLAVDILHVLRNSNVSLIIAGDGADKKHITERICELNVESQCRMIGWLDDPGRIYEAADLTILPSEFEGSPNAILESIAYDTPVFGARAPGIEEMLPEELLFDPDNIQDTADRIRKVIDDLSIRSSVSSLIKTIREKYTFDWDARVVDILNQE